MKKLYIKNMVCDRCKQVVRNELEKSDISFGALELGEVELTIEPSGKSLTQFKKSIEAAGFELIEDKTSRVISKIKNLAVDYAKNPAKQNFSSVLSDELHKDYSSLSALFSSIEGITIEKYLILQRIEQIKELIMYDELSLSQIANKLGYSSINHLSAQFKKITGLSPSHFKKLKENKRISIDKVGK